MCILSNRTRNLYKFASFVFRLSFLLARLDCKLIEEFNKEKNMITPYIVKVAKNVAGFETLL